MTPHPVVEALHKLEDGLPGLPSCLERSALYTFTLERSEKGFGDGIVVTVACATHARCDTDFRQQGAIGIDFNTAIPDLNERATRLLGADQAEPKASPPR